MPARIYALAKELNIDSKDLVDLVKKVGITGKGSALASLSDEEAQRVRDHLAGAGADSKPQAATAVADKAAPAAVREAVVPERKPKSIQIGRSSGPISRAGTKTGGKPKGDAPLRAPVSLPPVEETAAPAEPAAQAPEVKLPGKTRTPGQRWSGRPGSRNAGCRRRARQSGPAGSRR